MANFLFLACHPDVDAEYFAFSDQDDVWDNEKLSRAIDWLDTVPDDIPTLYCSRTRLMDADGQYIGESPLFPKPAGFCNALVQSIAGGNTMVFNQATKNLLCLVGKDVDVVSHDWWLYLLVSSCGGKVNYDPRPSLSYRQHGDNLIGSNKGWRARFERFGRMLRNRFRGWNDRNMAALAKIRLEMTPENIKIFDTFVSSRKKWLLPRLTGVYRSGVYRQTALGNIGLALAALIKKI